MDPGRQVRAIPVESDGVTDTQPGALPMPTSATTVTDGLSGEAQAFAPAGSPGGVEVKISD